MQFAARGGFLCEFARDAAARGRCGRAGGPQRLAVARLAKLELSTRQHTPNCWSKLERGTQGYPQTYIKFHRSIEFSLQSGCA